MHTATITKRLHGCYQVTCPQGCKLGTSASQATRKGAERRVTLHEIATTSADEQYRQARKAR